MVPSAAGGGIFAAMGFNHVVPMVLMAVQGFIQVVGRSFLELTGMWTFSGRMTMCQK